MSSSTAPKLSWFESRYGRQSLSPRMNVIVGMVVLYFESLRD
jgi:hypothetical protein